jgi:hypothetical protein
MYCVEFGDPLRGKFFFCLNHGRPQDITDRCIKNGARQTPESFRVASEALKTAEIVISWFDSLLRIGVVHDFGRIMAALF